MKPGCAAAVAAWSFAAVPAEKPTAPSVAVWLSTNGAALAHGMRSAGPLSTDRMGSTHIMSVCVSSPACASNDPASLLLAVVRMPHVPPAVGENGTTTSWVTSMTESTFPAAPQYTLKSAARTAPLYVHS